MLPPAAEVCSRPLVPDELEVWAAGAGAGALAGGGNPLLMCVSAKGSPSQFLIHVVPLAMQNLGSTPQKIIDCVKIS